MTYKTTVADERYFESRVRHWQAYFSLGDWRIEVYRKDIGDLMGSCEMWHNAQGAHITLTEKLHHKPEKAWLDRLALHEVSHCLLYPLKHLITDKGVEDIADTMEHAIIRRLENVLT